MKKLLLILVLFIPILTFSQSPGDVRYNIPLVQWEFYNGVTWVAQATPSSVDPETFPNIDNKNDAIGKYVYTNTGGEGKIPVDSIPSWFGSGGSADFSIQNCTPDSLPFLKIENQFHPQASQFLQLLGNDLATIQDTLIAGIENLYKDDGLVATRLSGGDSLNMQSFRIEDYPCGCEVDSFYVHVGVDALTGGVVFPIVSLNNYGILPMDGPIASTGNVVLRYNDKPSVIFGGQPWNGVTIDPPLPDLFDPIDYAKSSMFFTLTTPNNSADGAVSWSIDYIYVQYFTDCSDQPLPTYITIDADTNLIYGYQRDFEIPEPVDISVKADTTSILWDNLLGYIRLKGGVSSDGFEFNSDSTFVGIDRFDGNDTEGFFVTHTRDDSKYLLGISAQGQYLFGKSETGGSQVVGHFIDGVSRLYLGGGGDANDKSAIVGFPSFSRAQLEYNSYFFGNDAGDDNYAYLTQDSVRFSADSVILLQPREDSSIIKISDHNETVDISVTDSLLEISANVPNSEIKIDLESSDAELNYSAGFNPYGSTISDISFHVLKEIDASNHVAREMSVIELLSLIVGAEEFLDYSVGNVLSNSESSGQVIIENLSGSDTLNLNGRQVYGYTTSVKINETIGVNTLVVNAGAGNTIDGSQFYIMDNDWQNTIFRRLADDSFIIVAEYR